MEKNGRIVLVDRELSEGQQKLSRYIEHYTGIPFTGEKYSQWQTWVDLNKPYADHEKAKENASRDETTVRKHKPHDKKRGKEIACDADILYQVIRELGETNTHVCALCGFGHSYLSEIKKRGWLYESDIAKLEKLNIDPANYVTDAWYRSVKGMDVVDTIPEPVSTDENDAVWKTEDVVYDEDRKVVSVKVVGKDYAVVEITDELRGYCAFVRESPQDVVEKAISDFLDAEREMLGKLVSA